MRKRFVLLREIFVVVRKENSGGKHIFHRDLNVEKKLLIHAYFRPKNGRARLKKSPRIPF